MRFVLNFLFLSVLVFGSSCAQQTSQENDLYIEAKEALNKKNYQKSVKLFQKLSNKRPSIKKYQVGLADSYLGLGGFELFEFLIDINNALNSSFNTEYLYFELKRFSSKYFSINRDKRTNLERALKIYYRIDAEDSHSKEDRLKKGLVHIFLLTQSLKDFVSKMEDELAKIPPPDKKLNRDPSIEDLNMEYDQFIKRFIQPIDESIYHSFRAYFNLKSSFSEVEELLLEIDFALERTFGPAYQGIKEDLQSMSFIKFIKLFLKYNPQIYKDFMSKVLKTCDRKVAITNLFIIENTILSEYNNHQFKDSALQLVKETRKYIESHEQNICHI